MNTPFCYSLAIASARAIGTHNALLFQGGRIAYRESGATIPCLGALARFVLALKG